MAALPLSSPNMTRTGSACFAADLVTNPKEGSELESYHAHAQGQARDHAHRDGAKSRGGGRESSSSTFASESSARCRRFVTTGKMAAEFESQSRPQSWSAAPPPAPPMVATASALRPGTGPRAGAGAKGKGAGRAPDEVTHTEAACVSIPNLNGNSAASFIFYVQAELARGRRKPRLCL